MNRGSVVKIRQYYSGRARILHASTLKQLLECLAALGGRRHSRVQLAGIKLIISLMRQSSALDARYAQRASAAQRRVRRKRSGMTAEASRLFSNDSNSTVYRINSSVCSGYRVTVPAAMTSMLTRPLACEYILGGSYSQGKACHPARL